MTIGNHRWSGKDLLKKLAEWPEEAVVWVKAKLHTGAYEKALLDTSFSLEVPSSAVEALGQRLKALPNPAKKPGPAYAGLEDRLLIDRIRGESQGWNRNNVTRTEAYGRMYARHPELHWALLAHMVSRNGGWSMTDLQGELLPYLLSEEQRRNVFAFLERANALIFRDAYAQLLLYEESLRQRRPLFHLLPLLGVSRFMCGVWEQFWEDRRSVPLTIGLIVNEQHYIEDRVVRHPLYRRTVLDTLFFHTQSLLQLNHVVFPYREGRLIRLAGVTVEDFSSKKERIEVGKKLYGILFGLPAVHQGVLRFVSGSRHTGSRADFWPHLFAPKRQGPRIPRGELKERLDGCRLRPGALPLYSPSLQSAWSDRPIAPSEPGDWFRTEEVLAYFRTVEPPSSFEMTQAYGTGLGRIELAVLAGDLLE
ncbi:DUF2515 domain-containing protein [Paenibacillus caseinilyticus]|uniref:DUF2515 domain-containing protein n=1 Tax=Paenibacillus caseinilyticus TaxID=3098138 RepID=UPI0022B8A35E|nr:DUF2515 domain-containing protein [Paenibacillus caseinilyticus]MCZ8522366.1 DUF2515 domain-containing protein [Paenibacillus caseinilyticus]